MRVRVGLLIVLLALAHMSVWREDVTAAEHDYQKRLTVSFDKDWLFKKGDHTGGETPEVEDAGWRTLHLPHDWGIEGPFDQNNPSSGEGGFLPTGVGWYRKHFSVPADLKEKRVFIEFDGVMANSDVWMNGHHLGHRPSGYVGLRYEITDHLDFDDGEPNVVAVRADTSAQVASRWYTGSGIYRHVRLVFVEPVHIDFDGVFVTTPEVGADLATVHCQITIRNHDDSAKDFVLRTTILDPAGKPVTTSDVQGRVEAGSTATLNEATKLENPQLWDLASPQLYTAVHRIVCDGESTDEVSTRFGIREAEFRSDTGFWLNDKNVKIKGVCLHHAAGGLGAAIPLSVWEYRLQGLRELGVNAIRTAHNPVAPEFLDLCDEMGFLVMDETFDCWTIGKRRYDYHRYFDEWAHRDLRETLLRDRNHPCVIIYSAGNEIHDTPRPELAKRVLKGLLEVYRQVDPSRPVSQGLFRPNVSGDYDNGLADMLDVIGTNYRDQELLKAWRDDPTRKIIGTEQGHERRTWLACRDHPQHAGQFLWVGIDYLGESRRWPVTTFNSGLLDRTGHPHPRGYERQSWWSDQPMVRVFRRVAATEETPTDPGYETVEWKRRQVLFSDWTPHDLEPHRETVEVYSNCDEVELIHNGHSLGKKSLPPGAESRNWKVDFSPGSLLAIARNGGQEVARYELRTAGEAHRIQLTSNRKSLTPNWDDVAYVEAVVVDAKGTPLPREVREIAFSVQGPGVIAAVDSGSITTHEPFQASRRRTHQGRCIAIVRATENAIGSTLGEMIVTAEAAGLEPGQLELTISQD